MDLRWAGLRVARVIYTLVGLAAIWCISLLFRGRDEIDGGTEDA